jgi:hypothetical protein
MEQFWGPFLGALFGGQNYRRERGGRELDWAWFGAFRVYPGCVAVGGGAVKAIVLCNSKLQKCVLSETPPEVQYHLLHILFKYGSIFWKKLSIYCAFCLVDKS